MALYGIGTYGSSTYGIVLNMSYNPIRDEVFIAKNFDTSYVLSKSGLSAISVGIDDIAYHFGKLFIQAQSAIVQDDISFSTDIINFKSQGLKALEWIQLNIDCPESIFVTVRYRDSIKDAFLSAPQKQFNQEGVCRIGVRGVDFILDFSIPNFTTLQLDSMLLSVQFIDKRFRRGINVNNIRR